MSLIYKSFLILGATTLVSCAVSPTSTGRYLQAKHPISGLNVFQFVLPTADGCAVTLVAMSAKEKALAGVFRCGDGFPSQEMKARTTLYDKTFRYSFDLETMTLGLCESVLKDFLTSAGPDAVTVITPCSAK